MAATADLLAFMERPQSRPGVAPRDLEPHPLAALIPEMGNDEYGALVADIKARGLMEPVVLHEGKILDGRHRYRACRDAGRSADFTEYVGSDPAGYVVALNLHRRHLTREQRRRLIAELLKRKPEKSDRQIAATVGASPSTVGAVRSELEEAADVSKLDTRVDSLGRRQPATRPRPEPADGIFDDGYWSHVEAGLDTSPRRSRRSRRTHLAAAEAKLPGGERSWEDIVGLVNADFGRGGRKNYPPEHIARRAAVALVEGIDGIAGIDGIDGRDRAAIVGELHKARSTLSKIIRSLETS